MPKENQRIRLSKTLLKNALLSLLAKKPLEKISVHEICQTAEVNRTTFYKYYGNEADLLREITADFFSEFKTTLYDLSVSSSDSLERALEYLNVHRDMFRILVNSIPDQIFTDRLFSLPEIRDAFYGSIDVGETETQRKYMELFFFQGGYAIIREWLNSETPEPASEIAGLLRYVGGKMK